MTGQLFLVSTPIGNLKDITLRALETLFGSDIIACEDVRLTKNLISHFKNKINTGKIKLEGITTKFDAELISYYDEVEQYKTPELIDLLISGKNISLVTDSGTPLISDPGYRLVREAIKKNIRIIPIPGPAAFVSSLIISGFPVNRFLFTGFTPEKSGKRRLFYEEIKKMTGNTAVKPAVVFYESPHRIYKSLEELKSVFGDIKIALSRELTKLHEEILRGTVSEIIKEKQISKGEITVVFFPE
ncbi:16S rRNA (cytidine(1402)-2'-O)-methyltransferase [Candidatus Gottesmanbacteria bacterium RIFCSPLOWO2_01_FULL_40_10]|nr:MAG: 16S rRNA (cytidine(1402)-2'-O)-methyltransferase [Candidatus Gottesmanbacteria bacterium RIFCSPLOWO2_01_FULL_40_10]OGG25977.1 MAG: 16S rRNA (cytidine(1402)-2'-O)-methyltransferase [Candidatus Gottesmanbacteria bacterium RIFCSPHIGHO2_12_FULL_40_13]